MKYLFPLVLILLTTIVVNNCSKQPNVYSIDDYLEAYFPGEPTLHKSFEKEIGTFVIYNYQDDYKNIQYVALYIILKEKPKDYKSSLYSYVHSSAKGWDSTTL